MKKFVLMVAMVVSCVCMAQNSHAQTGRDGNTDIDMLSMKNFYAIDIVDVDLAAQEAIYNAIRSLSRRLTSGIWLSLSTKAAMC